MAQNDVSVRHHWNNQRGYEPFRNISDDGILLNDTTSEPVSDGFRLRTPVKDFTLRFVAANAHNHPSRSYSFTANDGSREKVKNPVWGFYLRGERGDSLTVLVKTGEEENIISSESVLGITVFTSNDKKIPVTVRAKNGVDCHEGNNLWKLTVSGGIAKLYCGNHGLRELARIPMDVSHATEFGFISYPGACLKIRDVSFAVDDVTESVRQTSWSNPDHLRNYLSASKDPIEGYWMIFDRSLEESLLMLGGDYRFAIVKDGERYQVIYLSGARVSEGKWRPGMVKAYLEPDPFPGIFNVTWFDSEGKALSNAVKAQTEDGDILSVQFPYHSSTMRLRKLP